MKLIRVGIKNYRSIGGEYVFIDFNKKINLFIGANNCGKSNVLCALKLLSEKAQPFKLLLETDRHQRQLTLDPEFRFEFSPEFSDSHYLKLCEIVSIDWARQEQTGRVIGCNFLNSLSFSQFNDFMYEVLHKRLGSIPSLQQQQEEANKIAQYYFYNYITTFSEVVLIPQFRQITKSNTYSFAGEGIVARLASWQHPEIGSDKDHEKFLKIETLLRRLLEMPKISLEVPHKQDQILVTNNGLRLPLAAYGTGIQELIIIAIAVLSKENAIFCIEEPEIHLHPLLQKKLIEFLSKDTPNKYLISTHSPALIAPQQDTIVTHLWMENGATKSRQVETTEHSLGILHDLGVQQSDLLQANSVIWVEGPSDRVFLNKWLSLLDPELKEEIDYSVMFYGGKLLAHLCLERDNEKVEEDFVKLLRINQHSAILIDSDKDSEQKELNKTKQRIQAECEKNGVQCWITSGREIENYLAVSAIVKAYFEITSIEPTLVLENFDRLEDNLQEAYGDKWKSSWSYDKAKPATARIIAKNLEINMITEDLKEELLQIVAVIRHKRKAV